MRQEPEEPPPILTTWARLYRAILLYLAALILLFYWFTITYNR